MSCVTVKNAAKGSATKTTRIAISHFLPFELTQGDYQRPKRSQGNSYTNLGDIYHILFG